MESYKSQLATLESKNKDLVLEKSKVEFELNAAQSKVQSLEQEKFRDHEQISAMEERMRELELGGGIHSN